MPARLPPFAELTVAARVARRELRGGLAGFRIFLACLILGVAAIATVQSVSSGIMDSLRADGRAILGGDLSIRQIYQPLAAEEIAHLERLGRVSATADLRSMVRTLDGGDSTLVEAKGVDGAYPLYGNVRLQGGGALDEALTLRDGVWGTALEPAVIDRLGLSVGDRVRLGDIALEVRAVIEREPDRASGAGFAFGPRLMLSLDALAESGLLQPGSMIYFHHRVALPDGVSAEVAANELRAAFPEATWQVRDYSRAAPSLERTIQRLTLFLTLVGLTALLVGGVGVGNAVKAYMDGKLATVATLKCVGAPGRLVFQAYLLQILALAALGIAIGLAIGAAAPLALNSIVADLLPIEARLGVYPEALLIAAAFGLLTALTFCLWPLARAQEVPAGALFRDLVAPTRGWPTAAPLAAIGLAGLALAGLAVVTAQERTFALYFVLGAIATLLAFRAAAWLVMAAGRRMGRPRAPALRLALTNLHRPGAPTPNVVLSLGLGLTVLVAIALVEGNMTRQMRDNLPDTAPSFFFVDIQSDQIGAFSDLVTEMDGVRNLVRVPSLRGRLVAVNDVPADEALRDPEYAWLIRGDRGVTYRAEPLPSDRLLAGAWWPADYAGPPLVSIYQDIARAFEVGIGDRLTVNVLGRNLEAEIANIREVDWGTMGLNFTMVFSPQPLASAPHTFVATLQTVPENETALQRAVVERFANVTAIRVSEALEVAADILTKIGTAVRSIAAVTLVAGTLVLAGAIAAGHRRRVYDSVVLKVLGATRGTVLRTFLLEYGLLGLLTAAIASLVGTVTAWAVVTRVMQIDWVFLAPTVATTALLCAAITVGFGFVGTWRALGQKAAPLLRNE